MAGTCAGNLNIKTAKTRGDQRSAFIVQKKPPYRPQLRRSNLIHALAPGSHAIRGKPSLHRQTYHQKVGAPPVVRGRKYMNLRHSAWPSSMATFSPTGNGPSMWGEVCAVA